MHSHACHTCAGCHEGPTMEGGAAGMPIFQGEERQRCSQQPPALGASSWTRAAEVDTESQGTESQGGFSLQAGLSKTSREHARKCPLVKSPHAQACTHAGAHTRMHMRTRACACV